MIFTKTFLLVSWISYPVQNYRHKILMDSTGFENKLKLKNFFQKVEVSCFGLKAVLVF
jgi:hypothetical protein